MNYFARTIDDYLALVTSQYAESTNFLATLTANIAPFCELQRLAVELIDTLSVDAAVGDLLDMIGLWVGVDRRISVANTDSWFSWDDGVAKGWNQAVTGQWREDYDLTGDSEVLTDEYYRRVIKAKIHANQCSYGKEDYYTILEILFPFATFGHVFTVTDNFDMTFTIEYELAMSTTNKNILLSETIPLAPSGVTAIYTGV